MSLQVGSLCYATPVDAGSAACSSFVPVASVDASGVRTVSCVGSDQVTGALNLQVALTPPGGSTTYSTISQLPSFPPCSHDEYLLAVEQIAGAVFACLAMTWGAWQIYKILHWSRGDA